MARRGNREGSIYQERSGLWAAAFYTDGKRKVMRAKTRELAARKLTLAMADAAKGLAPISETMTTGAWLTYWLDAVLPGTVKDSSVATYRGRVNQWVMPYVGKVPLAKLAPEHVTAMMRRLEAQGLTTAPTQARIVLGKALKDAYRQGKVNRIVTSMVDAPQRQAHRLDDSLSADEARAVMAEARGNRLEALAALVLTMGLRQAEALDLLWEDVDLEAATLTVRASKSRAGLRSLELPAFLVEVLRAHRHQQNLEILAAPFWEDAGLVFTDEAGNRLGARRTLRWWHALTIAAGVGRRRMHATRHTAATLMLERGIPLEVISRMLGHANYAITVDIYAKVKPQAMRAAAESLADLFS